MSLEVGAGGQSHTSANLSWGKILGSSCRRVWVRSGRMQKISPSLGFEPHSVQPVVDRLRGFHFLQRDFYCIRSDMKLE
jgi:hypothetical protein